MINTALILGAYLRFSLVSFDSLEHPSGIELLGGDSSPNELSPRAENADDEEEEGIMTDDEDDFDTGADELLPDSDAGDSFVYELAASTEMFKGVRIKLK